MLWIQMPRVNLIQVRLNKGNAPTDVSGPQPRLEASFENARGEMARLNDKYSNRFYSAAILFDVKKDLRQGQ